MIEKRCPKCNHLLYKYKDNPTVEIKCNKCKSLFTFASVEMQELCLMQYGFELFGCTPIEKEQSLIAKAQKEYFIKEKLELDLVYSEERSDFLYRFRFIGVKK